MHFLAICRPKFQTFSLPCLPWGHPTEPPSWANIKETESLRKNSYRQKCLDKSLNVQFLRYRVRQTELFVILGHFFHFYLSQLMMLKIKILKKKKMKQMPGDIIILHRCTIKDNHMMCGSWDTECDGQNVLSFWTISCPFAP